MATPSTSRSNSRFSSLNVFKFASSSKPPPLPPKDPYYLPNPSLPSLNHSLSLSSTPVTPLSAHYAHLARSPSPSPSYTPSRLTMSPAPSASSSALSPDSAGIRKGLRKLSSFAKRPKTPKTPEPHNLDVQPPEPTDDPSISMPWNFQHNVHVDEGYNGLPPTWSERLTEMGLSEDEIAAINDRRALRNTQSIYYPSTDRNTIITPSAPPSIQRGLSEASVSRTSLVSSLSVSAPQARMHYRNPSATTSSSDVAASETSGRLPPPVTRSRAFTPPTRPPPVPSELSSGSTSSGSAKDSVPRTPPRRAYHVANDSLSSMPSPPPAYTSARKDSPLNDAEKDFNPEPVQKVESKRLESERVVSPVASSSAWPQLTAPPRLSLHQDGLGDLSSWSASLFSIMPATNATPSTPPPKTTRQFLPPIGTPPNTIERSPAPIRLRAASHHSRSPSGHRQLPPQKPVPLHDLPARIALAPASFNKTPTTAETSNPLWQEVMELVHPPSEASSMPTPRSSPQSKLTPGLTTSPSVASSCMPSTPQTELAEPDTLAPPRTPTSPAISSEYGHGSEDGTLQVHTREKENRDSDMSTMTVVPATIERGTVVRSARGNIVASPTKGNDDQAGERQSGFLTDSPAVSAGEASDVGDDASRRSHSPISSDSRSSGSSVSTTAFGTASTSSSTYAQGSLPSSPQTATFAAAEREREARADKAKGELPELSLDLDLDIDLDLLRRPSILIDDIIATGALSSDSMFPSPTLVPVPEPSFASSSPSPSTPAPRYPGWVSEVVEPLSEYINELDPRELYGDLREIGEGESGSVYAARVLSSGKVKSATAHDYVAIKNIPLLPSGSPKLLDLQRELRLTRGISHPNVLSMEEVYVDVVDDGLWIKMELMERSLADIVMLVEEGIVVGEECIAQLASDVLNALSYLQARGMAHRDLRSDNLLVNSHGVVKIADFSSAVQVSHDDPIRSDTTGVIYWQPPEMRSGSYNALKVDVWSLGATAWEMAQAEPPFQDIADPSQLPDRWPRLNQPDLFSRSFHDFLHSCSQPSSSRLDPDDLLEIPFIRDADGRSAILELLSGCRAIDQRLARRQSASSEATVS